MAFLRGVVDVAALLTPDTCYQKRTGRCSLELVQQFSLRPESTLCENELLFCPRLRELMMAQSLTPLAAKPCRCGHVLLEKGAQCACIAEREQATLTLVSVNTPHPLCPVCETKHPDACHWNVRALVSK